MAYDQLVVKQGLTLPVNTVAACQDLFFYQHPIAPDVSNGLPPRSANYGCMGAQMRSGYIWLGIAGGFLMVILMMRNAKAAILFGILFVTFISWIPTEGNKATYFKVYSQIEGGEARFQYFLKGGTVPSVKMSALQLDFGALSNVSVRRGGARRGLHGA
jgi:xanthine/uracil/vitamin C permease (AzgA family)